VAVAGTLHRDDITTPYGRRTADGGSAVYFAVAAARYTRVFLNGVVGRDTEAAHRLLLSRLPIDLDGLVVSDAPTVVWHVEHDFERWVTRSEATEAGCDGEWPGTLAAESRTAPVLFLASLDPAKQLAALHGSGARLVGADSMTVFMGDRAGAVREVAAGSDILFLNAAEAQALSGEPEWHAAARALLGIGRVRAVVVKRGPLGAACVTRARVAELPAIDVSPVVDPTGAGDALAGGFLGYCAAVERDDDEVFAPALQHGIRCAADAIAAFGVEGLRRGSLAGAAGPGDV